MSKLFYAFIAFLIVAPLLGPGYLLLLDLQWGPNTFADFQFTDFYGYSIRPYGAVMPLNLVLAALSDIIPLDTLQKLFLFVILFVCGFSMHSFLPKDYGNARYLGGLFYMLNPFVFIRVISGHWDLLLSYALWPFALGSFLAFLKKPDKHNLVRVALLTFLVSINIHGLLMLLFIYMIFFIFSRHSVELIKQAIILAVLFVTLNLFWIVPALLMFESNYSPAPAESYLADFGAKGDILSLLTLHGFWRGGFTYTKDVFDLWFIPFIIILGLAVFGFVKMKDNSLALPLLILFVIAILLTLTDFLPSILGPVADLVFFAFRDTQKFVAVMALVYSIFASYGLSRIKLNPEFLIIFFLALPVIYNFGFFGFLDQVHPTQYPHDWIEAEKIIAADPTDTKILILPSHLYMYQGWIANQQKTVGPVAVQFFSKPAIISSNIETDNIASDKIDPYHEYMSDLYENRQSINNTAELLLPLNVRYVLLFKNYENSPHYLFLFWRHGGIDNIELIYESDSFYLFRNNLATQPFFSTDDSTMGTVEYEKINPARFKIMDSEYQTVVFTDQRQVSFNNRSTDLWNGIAQQFTFSEKGILENPMFSLVVALFLLSWLVIILLSLELSIIHRILTFVVFVLFHFLATESVIGPHAIGWLVIVTAVFFVVKTNWHNIQNFINFKRF